MKTTVKVNFPTQFAQMVGNLKEVEFSGNKLSDLFSYLDGTFGEISERIFEDGEVRPYLNLFVGSKNVNSLDGVDTVVSNGEKVSLLLSRAGG